MARSDLNATEHICSKSCAVKQELSRTFAVLPIFCQNEALGASAQVGVNGADALVLTAVLERQTHIQTCVEKHRLLCSSLKTLHR